MAQAAESHAELLVHNLKKREIRQTNLCAYEPVQRMCFISLGPKRALFTNGDKIVMDSKIVSGLKQIVEYKVIAELKK